jgi:hypothetical protein
MTGIDDDQAHRFILAEERKDAREQDAETHIHEFSGQMKKGRLFLAG